MTPQEEIGEPLQDAVSVPAPTRDRLRDDLVTLTKARLSILVLVTTFFGYLAAVRAGHSAFSVAILVHTLFGTILCAFGAAVFNQVMEHEADARMQRTRDRPLPSRRLPVGGAFALGWVLAGFGLVHLAMKVNLASACCAAATLGSYLFIYTPLKRRSSWNTVVGAVSGAIPPLIGWAAGGGGMDTGALTLFALLFLWQLPHFAAINWMYREEYLRGGFVMWSNDDASGRLTSGLALLFAASLALLPLLPVAAGDTTWPFLVVGGALGAVMVLLALRFRRSRERTDARRLFFYTLVYLPLVLVAALLTWR